ncbi:MAG TPA: transglycosylase domain-containing protein [Steroidobacteraceae bacterium]|nr:transglycosylase domain-containing protein [Steroidobacteraceae bacterium]
MNPILLRSLRWAAIGLGGLVLAFVFALACTFVYLAPSLPTKDNMHRLLQLSVPLTVYTASGAVMGRIGEERRIPVEFEDIPLIVRQAVLAAEDDRFFEHRGLDWMGVARAVFKTATGGSSQGGSTISQQAARNVFLSLDRTMRRKMSEVFVTWRMERDFSKEEILAIYLNKIFFGQRSYGIAAAAQTYFGKHLDELTVAEAAMLAGIIQSPAIQNPIRSVKNAESRRAYVLRRMAELGFIDEATHEASRNEPIVSRDHGSLTDVEGPYVVEMVRQFVVDKFGEAALNSGYKVTTTVDDRAQAAANRAMRVGLLTVDQRKGYRGPLGKVEVPAASTDAELDVLLGEFRPVGVLEPAVVLQVAATTAEVHIRGRGKARISWEGMSWAAKALRNGVGAAPKKAADVLNRGEVVQVIADGRGNARLAQEPKAQGALVSMNPVDGAVVALVGGFDFYRNQFNRVTQANRQPGSSFKPFLYSAALENGFTPATTIYDLPVMVDDSETEQAWRPQNSGGEFGGLMRLREALVYSRNLVSIRILQDIGVNNFIGYASQFGFDAKKMPPNLTLALGTLSATPMQMARGYSVFANGGFRVEPYWILRVEDAAGEVVYQAEPLLACAACEAPESSPLVTAGLPPGVAGEAVESSELDAAEPQDIEGAQTLPVVMEGGSPVDAANPGAGLLEAPTTALFGMEDIPEGMRELASVQGGRGFLPEERLAPRVITPQNAWLMSDIMHEVTTRGTARRTRSMGRDDLAGKTGTTNDGRDTWFNGFTRDLVTSVWVGHDDNSPLGDREEGATTAVPIWMYFMGEALKETPSSRPPRPPGLVDVRISPVTGHRAHPLDPGAVVEKFFVDRLPKEPSPGEGYVPAEGGGSSGAPIF